MRFDAVCCWRAKGSGDWESYMTLEKGSGELLGHKIIKKSNRSRTQETGFDLTAVLDDVNVTVASLSLCFSQDAAWMLQLSKNKKGVLEKSVSSKAQSYPERRGSGRAVPGSEEDWRQMAFLESVYSSVSHVRGERYLPMPDIYYSRTGVYIAGHEWTGTWLLLLSGGMPAPVGGCLLSVTRLIMVLPGLPDWSHSGAHRASDPEVYVRCSSRSSIHLSPFH